MKAGFSYINGTILPSPEARVGVTDIGLTRGFGVYDGIAALHGNIFRFEDHFNRFQNSAKGLGLSVPVSKSDLERSIKELLKKNSHMARANIRLLLTGGSTVHGIEFDPKNPTFIILTEQHEPLETQVYTKGAKLIIHEYQRFMPEHKTTHYITAVLLQNKRKEEGAIEILYTSNGLVRECATSNFFMVKNGALVTPQAHILKGITRKVVLELSNDLYPKEERDIPVSELASADELFITSSFKDIVPIVNIGGELRGGSTPGPITQEIMKRFSNYFEGA